MKIDNGQRETVINDIVEKLCAPQSYEAVSHRSNHDMPMPSTEALSEAVELLRAILFPGYYGVSELKPSTMHYYVGTTLDKVCRILSDQIKRGFCFICSEGENVECVDCDARASNLTADFVSRLPEIRRMLSTDVQAAFEGDPAAKSPSEAIFCYPSIKAMTNFRIAHELYLLGVPLIPRIITEIAHSENGIDIHPGAHIGEKFFMDHGTGIVIGETSLIGRNVRLYQGVTLGAKSFPLDENGNPIKGVARHPVVEDDVIIYSGATILGRVVMGVGSIIGGNVWLTHDVPAGMRIMQSSAREDFFDTGSGI
jgi:serine O-acetyltransferase